MTQKDKNKLAMLIGGEIAEFNKGNRDCNYVVNFIEKREKRIELEARIEELEYLDYIDTRLATIRQEKEGYTDGEDKMRGKINKRIKELKKQLIKLKTEKKWGK